jgi:hypothetical protein
MSVLVIVAFLGGVIKPCINKAKGVEHFTPNAEYAAEYEPVTNQPFAHGDYG